MMYLAQVRRGRKHTLEDRRVAGHGAVGLSAFVPVFSEH